MQERALSDLVRNGYTVDRISRRARERRYCWIAIPGLVLCVLPIVVGYFDWPLFADSFHQFAALMFSFAVGACLLGGGAAYRHGTPPVSCHSGARMQQFRRSDSPRGTTEDIFVDGISRTYYTEEVTYSGC